MPRIKTTHRRSRHSAFSESTWRRLGWTNIWHVELGLDVQSQHRRPWDVFCEVGELRITKAYLYLMHMRARSPQGGHRRRKSRPQ